jgi:hypothetical protein
MFDERAFVFMPFKIEISYKAKRKNLLSPGSSEKRQKGTFIVVPAFSFSCLA